MGTDRKIKSDGQVHIESTNVDINSTVDVTGDVNATGDLDGATVTTTGNATIGGDVDATGDIGGATSTITGDASVGGDLTVTGDTSTTDLTASGTGSFTGNLSVSSINNLTFPTSDGTNGQVVTTDGAGTLSFTSASSQSNSFTGDVDITGNLDVTGTTTTANLTCAGTNTLGGLVYPSSDGTNGQAILTDGAGNLSFGTVASGGGGGGYDEISTQTEADNYTGTNPIVIVSNGSSAITLGSFSHKTIRITGTGVVTFDGDLLCCDVTYDYQVILENITVKKCSFKTYSVTFKNSSTDGTTKTDAYDSSFQCYEIYTTFNDISGNDLRLYNCTLKTTNSFYWGNYSNADIIMSGSNLIAGSDIYFYGSNTNVLNTDIVAKQLRTNLYFSSTQFRLSTVTLRDGTGSGGNVYIDGDHYVGQNRGQYMEITDDGVNALVAGSRRASSNITMTGANTELLLSVPSLWQKNTNWTNTRFTAWIKGQYQVNVKIYFTGVDQSTQLAGGRWHLNGSAYEYVKYGKVTTTDSSFPELVEQTIFDLDKDDYLEFKTYSVDSSYVVALYSRIEIFKIN